MMTTSTWSWTRRSHFQGATPFKVQVNFDIPLFESQIDGDIVHKWLSLLEGYFFVHNFYNTEKIIFSLLKVVPHVRDWWDTYCEQNPIDEKDILGGGEPTWASFVDVVKRNSTFSETIMISTRDGQLCARRETRWC